MVMADFVSRDRGKRGRGRGFRRRGNDRYRNYYGDREGEEDDYHVNEYYRGNSSQGKSYYDRNSYNDYGYRNSYRDKSPNVPSPQAESPSKPIVMLKAHNDGDAKVSTGTSNSITNLLANDAMPAHAYKEKKSTRSVVIEGSVASRLAPPPEMSRSMKLIDENLNWCENPVNMLLDQTDFLTVGVLGLQGVGKSTLLSLLSGNTIQDDHKSFVFKPQTKEDRDICKHQTTGIDIHVSEERVVLLDSQAVLSASALDYLIRNDKKYLTEYSTAENCIEIQSLQSASLLLTVCNVMVVVLDWFVDLSLLGLLETAEMLKPATPSGGSDNHDSSQEFYPHVVFVLNGASGEDFSLENYRAMQAALAKVLKHSKLKYTDGPNMVNLGLMPASRGDGSGEAEGRDVNLVLLPRSDTEQAPAERRKPSAKEGALSLLGGYRGHHSFAHTLQRFRNALFAVPRQPHANTLLSEKNWFHYAARSWESIKKSALFSEYNRLLP